MTLPKTLLFVSLSCALSSTGRAQTCEPGDLQDSLQYLRRVSLDLRGRVPTVAELSSVVATGAVDQALVRQMLDSEELVEQMRRYHRDLLWTNVIDRRIAQNAWILQGPNGRRRSPAYFVPAQVRTATYRGAAGAGCLDEPAEIDPATGEILTTPDEDDPSIRREGWVEVTPYWAPGTTVRVCAFDAQENLTAVDPRNGNQVDCSRSPNVRGCGCGPNLAWCQSGDDRTIQTILLSMNEQLLRFTDRIVRENRPYTDVILAKDMELNGPIVHWLKNQSQTAGGLIPSSPAQNHPLPDLEFADAGWVEVERGQRHSGVLSMPGYLVKFQSNRGRANRFYNAFLCQHFESSAPLPPATDECHREPDLTKRCGCKDCHTTLEPAAGHWGRWAEGGLLPLEEPLFPKYNPACVQGGGGRANALCGLFYFTQRDVTDPETEQQYIGLLKPYVYASEQTEQNIEAGPEKIAREAVDSGAFAACTVKRMWSRFMAREPTPEEQTAISDLAEDFATDYSLRRLIEQLVARPEYVNPNAPATSAK